MQLKSLIVAASVLVIFFVFLTIALCCYISYQKALAKQEAETKIQLAENRNKKRGELLETKEAYQ